MKKCQGEPNCEEAAQGQEQKTAAIACEKSGWGRSFKAGASHLLVRWVHRSQGKHPFAI